MAIVPFHAKNADCRLFHSFNQLPVGFGAATAAASPSGFLLCKVVGLAVEVPKQGEVLVGNLFDSQGAYLIECCRQVVRTFLKLQRDGVVAACRGKGCGAVALGVGVEYAVVTHSLKPIYINSLGTSREVCLFVQAGEVDEVLRQCLLGGRIAYYGSVVLFVGCPGRGVLVVCFLS